MEGNDDVCDNHVGGNDVCDNHVGDMMYVCVCGWQ